VGETWVRGYVEICGRTYSLPKGTPVPDSDKEKFCRGNLSSGALNKEYVSVSDDPCKGLHPTESKYFTCGKPLVNLNVPSPK
jgi:hypothetical protein